MTQTTTTKRGPRDVNRGSGVSKGQAGTVPPDVEDHTASKTERRHHAGSRERHLSMIVPVAAIRGVTLLIDYALVMLTAFSVIPNLGVFVYNTSGVSETTVLSGQITFWLLPFVFVVAFAVIAEFMIMRGLWRTGTVWLDRIRERRASTITTEPTGEDTRHDQPDSDTRKRGRR